MNPWEEGIQARACCRGMPSLPGSPVSRKQGRVASEMAQQIDVLAAKPAHLSLVPRVKKERTNS